MRARERGRARHRGMRAVLALLLVAKVVGAGLWWQAGLAGALTAGGEPESPASRDEAGMPDAEAHTRGTAAREPLSIQGLLEAVARRQAELDAREQEIASRHELLQVFEKDVTAKLASLEEIEKRLTVRARTDSAALEAARVSLAKIYGAMKPADAAPILERLDEEMVVRIFQRMKEKQIGEILPLMSREKAIVLTRTLARPR